MIKYLFFLGNVKKTFWGKNVATVLCKILLNKGVHCRQDL
jgi:hypothetical protein